MPFWKDLSTGKYKKVTIKKQWEDLGRRFTVGEVIHVEILKNSEFYRCGMHLIPINHCGVPVKE